MINKLRKISQQKTTLATLVLPVVALCVFGSMAISAQSSSNSAAVEAEDGTITGQVTIIDSSLAAGGKFASFVQNGSGSGTYDNIPSNFDTSVNGPYRSVGPDNGNSASEPTGNFRVFCQFSHLGYYDPILAPGSNNFMHLHMFFGNDGVNQNTDYNSLRTTGGSTCSGGPINRTGYWMPALFDQNGDVVVPSLFIVYYKVEQTGSGSLAQKQAQLRTVQEYPNGFRYLGGKNSMTGQQYSDIRWKCEGGSGDGPRIPSSCPSGESLIASVRFPHCWDGENLWLPNNAHVGLGVGNSTWTECDANGTHPVYIPSLTEFAHFPSTSNMSGWYLSSDRMAAGSGNWFTNGNSWHADWFGAWDNEVQTTWIENCLRGLRNSNASLCDGTVLNGTPNYNGPNRISGWTPLHPNYGNNGWPVN